VDTEIRIMIRFPAKNTASTTASLTAILLIERDTADWTYRRPVIPQAASASNPSAIECQGAVFENGMRSA
jgi:adenylosuccinate lyase